MSALLPLFGGLPAAADVTQAGVVTGGGAITWPGWGVVPAADAWYLPLGGPFVTNDFPTPVGMGCAFNGAGIDSLALGSGVAVGGCGGVLFAGCTYIRVAVYMQMVCAVASTTGGATYLAGGQFVVTFTQTPPVMAFNVAGTWAAEVPTANLCLQVGGCP